MGLVADPNASYMKIKTTLSRKKSQLPLPPPYNQTMTGFGDSN
jgi:hypothetical protein